MLLGYTFVKLVIKTDYRLCFRVYLLPYDESGLFFVPIAVWFFYGLFLYGKVNLFWDAHKILKKSSNFIRLYLVTSKCCGRFFSIFSELLGIYKLIFTFPVFLMSNHQDQLFYNGEDTFEEKK